MEFAILVTMSIDQTIGKYLLVMKRHLFQLSLKWIVWAMYHGLRELINSGCSLSQSIDVDVEFGANDPDCKFATTDVLSEVVGDLFINDECQGVLELPSVMMVH